MNIFHQTLRFHPRLSFALAAGLVAGTAYPLSDSIITQALIGWNVIAWSYLLLMGWLMARASHAKVRLIAEQEDKGAIAILVIMSLGALASLAAIILELSTVRSLPLGARMTHYGFTISTVLGSWFLLGTLFTFHYARIFYRSPADNRALKFPDSQENLNYWDFLYFSFTIAVAAQTSDISVMSRSLRKTVLAQSILSFLFNVAIIGLSINIAASLVGG